MATTTPPFQTPPFSPSGTLPSYDYIVTGSGPGGSPLACRLALAGFSVLLIDAGSDTASDDLTIRVPAMNAFATEHPATRWDYFVDHYPSSQQQQKRDFKLSYKTPSGEIYTGRHPPPGAEPLGVLYPRAGALGGCAQHNAMITVYPHDSDWEYIANLTGDASWAPGNMRKYFERLEHCLYLPTSVVGHGFSGWLPTTVTNPEIILKDELLASLLVAAAGTMGMQKKDERRLEGGRGEGEEGEAEKLGILGGEHLLHHVKENLSTIEGLAEVLTQDLNSGLPGRDEREGLYQVPIHVKYPEYSRYTPRDWVVEVSGAKHEDGPKRGERKWHLDVLVDTLVTKVTFDIDQEGKKKPRATGVEFLRGRSLYRADPRSGNRAEHGDGIKGAVRAKREVIVSCGTFNTPQLLKLSGIGPREELEEHGIEVVKHLPGVGENLQDHYEISVIGSNPQPFHITHPSYASFSNPPSLHPPDPALTQWLAPTPLPPYPYKGTYHTNGFAFAYIAHSAFCTSPKAPDLYIDGAPVDFRGYFPGFSETGERVGERNRWSWVVLKSHPRTAGGWVRLRSKDPRDTPGVRFDYFPDSDGGAAGEEGDGKGDKGQGEKDLLATVEGVRYALRAFENTRPLPLPLNTLTSALETLEGKPKEERDGRFTVIWPDPAVTNLHDDEDLKTFVKDNAWGHHACCTCPIGGVGEGEEEGGVEVDELGRRRVDGKGKGRGRKAVLDSKFRVRGVDGLRVVDASVFPKIPGTYTVLPVYMISEKGAEAVLEDAGRWGV